MIRSTLVTLTVVLAALVAPATQAAEHRFGLGGHYWRTLDDLADEGFDVDEEGVAPYFSYQLVPRGLVFFELDLEYFDEGFGGATSEAFSPIVFALIGRSWYAGVGIGVTFSDDFEDDVSDPFYAARVGLNMELLPRLYLDLNANYRAGTFDELGDAGTDTITLGAAARIGF